MPINNASSYSPSAKLNFLMNWPSWAYIHVISSLICFSSHQHIFNAKVRTVSIPVISSIIFEAICFLNDYSFQYVSWKTLLWRKLYTTRNTRWEQLWDSPIVCHKVSILRTVLKQSSYLNSCQPKKVYLDHGCVSAYFMLTCSTTSE